MAKEKNIRLVLPAEFNSRLNHYLLELREIGVDITKARLIVNLADLGLKVEQKEIEITRL